MNQIALQTPTIGSSLGTPKRNWIVTVDVLASIYADAGKTSSAIRADIFKAEDRLNSRGERIAGNGLAAQGHSPWPEGPDRREPLRELACGPRSGGGLSWGDHG